MGCCSSDESTKEDKKLQKELAKDKKADAGVKKLLFLGSGGSGKSTLFKQLRTLHGTGYANKDRMQFKDHICAQIIEQMKSCLECVEILKEDEDYKREADLSPEAMAAAEIIESAPSMQVN